MRGNIIGALLMVEMKAYDHSVNGGCTIPFLADSISLARQIQYESSITSLSLFISPCIFSRSCPLVQDRGHVDISVGSIGFNNRYLNCIFEKSSTLTDRINPLEHYNECCK